MKTIRIPEPVDFSPTTPGPRRLPEKITFLQFVGHILGNVTGTLEIAQAISRTKRALQSAVDTGGGSVVISDEDHAVLLSICKQRQLHMFDFEQLETFFAAITDPE